MRIQNSAVCDPSDLSARTDRPDRIRSRVLLIALLCGAVAFSARAADDDLLAARNAVHDKLYAVAVTHARSHLKNVQAHPVDGVESLQLLLQAKHLQMEYFIVYRDLLLPGFSMELTFLHKHAFRLHSSEL